MKSVFLVVSAVLFLAICLPVLTGCKSEPSSLWAQKCSGCHDGKTVLNDQVVPDKEDLVSKYENMEQFMISCLTSPPCMDVLKNDEELFRQVGREMGIPE